MFVGQQHCRGHDLAGLTIAALRHVYFNPGLLKWVAEIRREALDRQDGFSHGG